MTEKNMDYYLDPANEGEWDKLTMDEQAAVWNTESNGEGSYGPDVDEVVEGGAEAEAAAAEDGEEAGKKPAEEKKVIQAKDGVNVIPYERLEETTEKLRLAEERLAQFQKTEAEQQKLISDLQEAAKADAAAGKETGKETTAAQDAVLEEYAGEFPEMMEDIGPYFKKMIEAGSMKQIEDLKAELATLKETLAPVQQLTETLNKEKEDFAKQDQINWQKAQDDFWNVEDNQIFKSDDRLYGLLNEEVKRLAVKGELEYDKLLDTAKANVIASISKAVGVKPKTEKEILAAAEAKIKAAEAEDNPPASLTDVAGSHVYTDEAEAAQHMNMGAATTKFLNMNPDKLEEYFAKVGL